jgi:hypothetical protein
MTSAPAAPDPDLGRALIEAATKASALVWLTVPGRSARPAWQVWEGAASYVVHAREDVASTEQPVPGLTGAGQVDVSVRGAADGRVVTWRAAVAAPRPGSAEWDAALELLRGKRVNAPDRDGIPQRWAQTCVISVLTPTGELIEQPGSYDRSSGSAPPPPSPATTVTRKPYVLGRRARRRPHL